MKRVRIIATRVAGKYWMYWGDQFIWAATSDDLINWTPVEMAAGEQPPIPLRGQVLNMPWLKIVVPTRAGKFDSDLVESGPPAMLDRQRYFADLQWPECTRHRRQ